MTDIDVSFHALREEIAPWIQSCVEDFHLYATAVRFPPYQAALAERKDLAKQILDPTVAIIELTRLPPNLPLVFPNQFYDQNPNALSITLGKLTDRGLSDSWMSARTLDKDSFAIWKSIARRLKSWTKTGAFVFNRTNNSSGPSRNQRFSAGARKLAGRGVILYEGNGAHVYRFSDKDTA